MTQKNKKIAMRIGVIIALVVMLCNFEKAASYVTYPFLVVQNTVATRLAQFSKIRKTAAELAAQVEQLEQENKKLLGNMVRLHASIDYLDELEELIDFKQRYDDGKGVLAQVLLKNFSAQSHFFIVDAGSSAGVEINMPVVLCNCLIGKVQEVYPLYSKILLITDRACKVAAYCSQTGSRGIYHGMNNTTYGLLEYVSHLDDIQEEDLIVSTGQGVIFPRGFALGRISTYERYDLDYSIVVEPLISLTDVSYVFILPVKV